MSDQIATPSKIPVSINKRASISVLQQSTSSNSLTSSRSQSPLTLTKAGSSGGRASPVLTAPSMGQRRWSLLSGGQPGSRKTSFSESLTMNGSQGAVAGASDDPSQIRAQITKLQLALQSAQQRLTDVESGDNSMSMPLTPVDGLVGLPEVEIGDDNGPLDDSLIEDPGEMSSLEPPNSGGSEGKPRLMGLPHSNPSFDLRSRAVTPGKIATPVNNKLPDGRSRIPQAVVAHAAALHPTSPARSPSRTHVSPPSPIQLSSDGRNLRSPFLAPESPQPLPSPSGANGIDGRLSPGLSPRQRLSSQGGSAASTRVIDSLQTDLVNTKVHLERVKQEVRSCQRVIGSLTRQTEDLKETRERMRVECEGLNNVIARKERLLQEVLERARTAEAALAQHQSTRKSLEQSTKKSIQHMTAQLSEAQAGQAKAERESTSLRESVKSLRDVWAREVKSVREEWKRGDEKGRREREEARQKHLSLVKLVQAQSADRATIQTLAETATTQSTLANHAFEVQVAALRAEIDRSARESKEAKAQAQELASELVRIRRLMREPRRDSLGEAASISSEPT